MDSVRIYAPQILVAFGIVFIIAGLTSIRPYSFSEQSAALIYIGASFTIASFLTHSQVSRENSAAEKVFAALICTSIALVASAVVVYTIVKVTPIAYETVLHRPGGRGVPVWAVTLKVTHIYESLTLSLLAIGIIIVIVSLYIRERYS